MAKSTKRNTSKRLTLTFANPVIQPLMIGILQNIDDWDRYVVLGDALEEAGELGFAITFRWMAEKKRHPRWNQRRKSPWLWSMLPRDQSKPWNLRPLLTTVAVSRHETYAECIAYLHDRLHTARSKVCISGDVGHWGGGYSDV